MQGLLTLRSHHGFRSSASASASASSSSWTPPPVAPPHWIRCKICFKCKRVTKGQNERCHFCKRPCCQMCMKWMPCCETWKCNECTCHCRRDKLRTMRLKRDRARIACLKSQGEGKRSGSDREARGRAAVRTPKGDIVCRRCSPVTKRSTSDNPKEVCIRYTKGRCTKSHAECPFVHNPKCIWHARGKCNKGAKCLFPHRTVNTPNTQLQTEDQIALQLGIGESKNEPEPGTNLTIIRTELSNAAEFSEAENIRNKVVKEDGDIPH